MERNSLHCFPFLLFVGEDTWIKTGVRDVNHLASKSKYHEYLKVHSINALRLNCLENLALLINLPANLENQHVSIMRMLRTTSISLILS